MLQRSKIQGHIVFVLSVILSFFNSVILSFCPSLWNFNFATNFWTVSSRALVFHMSIPCDKTFSWVPLFLTLWPWPWSLTHILKTLTLLISFEQWVLERQGSLVATNNFALMTLTLEFDLLFENFNLAKNFWTVSARVYTFHMNISSGKAFPRVPTCSILWPWPWNATNFLNINLANNFWTVSARAISCSIEQCLLVGTNNFDLVTLT